MKKYLAAMVLCVLCFTACAEAATLPVAMVNVNYGSWLNVRKTPAGELAYVTLQCRQDVIILETNGEWALVTTPERFRNGLPPLGWSSLEYLIIYRDFIYTKENDLR